MRKDDVIVRMSGKRPLLIVGGTVSSLETLGPVDRLAEMLRTGQTPPEPIFSDTRTVYRVVPIAGTESFSRTLRREVERTMDHDVTLRQRDFVDGILSNLVRVYPTFLQRGVRVGKTGDFRYSASLEVEEFVLRSPDDGQYYRFPKTAVSAELLLGESGELGFDEVVAPPDYRHPIVNHEYPSEGRICFGRTRQPDRDLPPEERTIQRLYAGRQMLQCGYPGYIPFSRLAGKRYEDMRISPEEAERLGITTNAHVERGVRRGLFR
jgi:hypothetical protein